MGAQKEILSAAALAGSVETLRTGLTGFESSTGQMKSIFEEFEERLGKLESEMLPMKDISAKLTMARRNISSAIAKMESINECFLLEKELRGVVQKGMRGNVGAVEYLEEMRRVNEAIMYFEKWPTLKSQRDAIRGLEELSNIAAKECIDEFNRLMRTVGPAVQFQAQTNTFESVDTLSDNVSSSLAAIGECLTLLNHDKQLRQNYTAARRVTVKTCLENWESRFESSTKGQEARGAGPWLRFYVDFSTKLVTAERLLWERALKATVPLEEEDLSRQGLEAENAFVMVVAPVIEKLVREVDRRISHSVQEVRDRHEGAMAGLASMGVGVTGHSGGGGSGGSHIRARAKGVSSSGGHAGVKEGDIPADVVVSLLEMSDALHKGTYSLQDILKVGDSPSSKGSDGGNGVGSQAKKGPQQRSPTSRSGQSPVRQREGRSNKATEALEGVQRRLSQACLQTFSELADTVSRDPKLRRHLPDDGSVHRLSSNVLRGIKRIMRFRRGYEEAMQGIKMPWDMGEAPSGGNSRDKGSQLSSKPRSALVGVSAAAKACPQFTALVNHLIKILFVNLTEKSTSYPTATLPGAALRDLFLLNNAEYVLANAKTPFSSLSVALNTPGSTESPTPSETFRSIFGGAPLGRGGVDDRSPKAGGVRSRSPMRWGIRGGKNKEAVARAVAARSAAEGLVGPDAGDDELAGLCIANFMTDQMLSLLKRLSQEKQTAYMDTLALPLVKACQDDVGELKYQRGKLLTLECGRVLKTKFSSFNETWEEVHASQLAVIIVDARLRERLKEETRKRCLAPYRAFYQKYQDVQFSKKHQEQYLKYTPEAIDEGIRQLFSG